MLASHSALIEELKTEVLGEPHVAFLECPGLTCSQQCILHYYLPWPLAQLPANYGRRKVTTSDSQTYHDRCSNCFFTLTSS